MNVQAIRDAFDACNLDIENDALPACQALCKDFNLSLDEITAQWDTFSMNQQLPGPATAESMLMFRSQLVQMRKAEINKEKYNTRSSQTSKRIASGRVYNTPVKKRDLSSFQSPIAKKQRNSIANDLFSPSSIASPPAGTYSNRKNAKSIVSEFNAHLLHQAKDDMSMEDHPVQVQIRKSDRQLPINTLYMHTCLEERAMALDKQLEIYERIVKKHYGIEELTAVGEPSPANVIVVGRVVCEAAEGRLNPSVVQLEGSRNSCGGKRVLLDLSNVEQFQIFPGKLVALEGVFAELRGPMRVKRFFDPIPPPMATSSKADIEEGTTAPLSVLTASGPFTTVDDMEYLPIHDLLQVVVEKKPNVLILIGPFVDAMHPKMKDGLVTFDGMLMSFEDVFIFKVLALLDAIMSAVPTLHVIFVPSIRDAHHHFVYPQPPFHQQAIREALQSSHYAKRIHFMANPCTFYINEVSIGVSSLDIIMHLSSTELYRAPASHQSNRLLRISEEIISQHSYYPLFPPYAEAPLDLKFQKFFQLEGTPDIIILPSILNRFCGRVRDSICLNPGQLCKGQSGGTYAEIQIYGSNKMAVSAQSPNDSHFAQSVPDRTFLRIVRI